MNFLYQKFLENEILNWAIAILIAISVLVILKILKSLIVNRLRALALKTETDIDDLIVDLLDRTHFFLLFMISIYAGSLVLSLPVKVSELLKGIAIIAFLLQIVIWGNGLINYWIARYRKEKLGEDAASVTTVSAVAFIGTLVLWSAILLLAL
ncbi:MAG: hypothetical protein ACE5H1_03555, partial [Thermodesulfobacteriota bacterium]